MKKLFFLTLAMAFIANFTFAQTPTAAEKREASKERYEKIWKLYDETPRYCNIHSIDDLTRTSRRLAYESLQISKILFENEVSEESPELSIRLARQLENLVNAIEALTRLDNEVKKLKNPIKLKKAVDCVKYIKETLPITKEESTYQFEYFNALAK